MGNKLDSYLIHLGLNFYLYKLKTNIKQALQSFRLDKESKISGNCSTHEVSFYEYLPL